MMSFQLFAFPSSQNASLQAVQTEPRSHFGNPTTTLPAPESGRNSSHPNSFNTTNPFNSKSINQRSTNVKKQWKRREREKKGISGLPQQPATTAAARVTTVLPRRPLRASDHDSNPSHPNPLSGHTNISHSRRQHKEEHSDGNYTSRPNPGPVAPVLRRPRKPLPPTKATNSSPVLLWWRRLHKEEERMVAAKGREEERKSWAEKEKK
ncbi:hypothetical protein Tsubulata_051354, partial [Turnera subulata]